MSKKQIKILNSAVILFIQNGIKKTTMDEIAQKANVSKVTIYKYFGDKDNLYFSVGIWILDEYITALDDIAKDTSSADILMCKTISTLTKFIAENKLNLCLELSRYSDSLESKYADFKQNYTALINQLIEKGKKDNIIKSTINNDYIFHYIDMGISYFNYNLDYRKKMINDENFKSEYMDFLLSHIFN